MIYSLLSHSSPFLSGSPDFEKFFPLAGFLIFSTVDILGKTIICWGGGGCPVHCWMAGGILALYPLDAGSIPILIVTVKNVVRPCWTSPRGTKSPQLRTTVLYKKVRWLFSACLPDSPKTESGDWGKQRGPRWVDLSLSMWYSTLHSQVSSGDWNLEHHSWVSSYKPVMNQCLEMVTCGPQGMAISCNSLLFKPQGGVLIQRNSKD